MKVEFFKEYFWVFTCNFKMSTLNKNCQPDLSVHALKTNFIKIKSDIFFYFISDKLNKLQTVKPSQNALEIFFP